MKINYMKLGEISKLTNHCLPQVSQFFKDFDDGLVNRVNNRIVGVCPESAEIYFRKAKAEYFYKPAIILSANLCGGVGKTSSIFNLGVALRRITNRETPIVYVDGDSQGSFTSAVFGKPADDTELLLIDFLENKATIDEILTEVSDNIWFVKSNLNQSWIDKVLSKPQDIKKGMLSFYQAIFSKLGKNTKIFQDHTPQLSNLFASSICALNQLDKSILKAVIIPIRSDKFAIQGAQYILKEIKELTETFSLKSDIDIHCFFSSLDKRVSTTAEALKETSKKPEIIKHLCPMVVRYCVEIPKSIMNTASIYGTGKLNKAAEDYQYLLRYIFQSNHDNSIG